MFSCQPDDPAFVPASGALRKIPGIPDKLEKRVLVSMAAMAQHIPANAAVVLRVLRIENPPRRIEFEWIVQVQVEEMSSLGCKALTGPQHALLETYSSVMIELATELLKRWPKGLRPEAIGMITDGKSIVFNAGRPEAFGLEWYNEHVSGGASAAVVVGELNTPLNLRWDI